MGRNLSNKYSKKLFDSAKKSITDAIKTASKRAIQKIAEGTGDLIGNKIADKITRFQTEFHSKKSTKELQNDKASNKIEAPKNRYISPEERQQIIDELRLVPKKKMYISKNIDELRLMLKERCIPPEKKTTNY